MKESPPSSEVVRSSAKQLKQVGEDWCLHVDLAPEVGTSGQLPMAWALRRACQQTDCYLKLPGPEASLSARHLLAFGLAGIHPEQVYISSSEIVGGILFSCRCQQKHWLSRLLRLLLLHLSAAIAAAEVLIVKRPKLSHPSCCHREKRGETWDGVKGTARCNTGVAFRLSLLIFWRYLVSWCWKQGVRWDGLHSL